VSGRVAIKPEAAAILSRASVSGTVVRLPADKLDRATYVAVDNVLKALGGKWDKRAGGHSFPFDPTDKLADALGSGAAVSRQKTLQLFETPETLARYLVSRLDVGPDDSCIEPSAGRGRIVAALAACRPFDLTAYEIDHDNGDALRAQGLCTNIFVKDFLTVKPREVLDVPVTVIAMNPPFTRNQDIKHVRHAFDCLSPGGRLGSIVSEHGFIGQERECQEWREWLGALGASIESLPIGTFAESGTNVATRLIVIEKAAA
jgi:predicted RNA methylase